jgi:hypothetical protein
MWVVKEWLFAWGPAFLTMLPIVVFVSPFIQRCVLALMVSAADEGYKLKGSGRQCCGALTAEIGTFRSVFEWQ